MMEKTNEQIMRELKWICGTQETDERDRYLLTEEEQDRAIILHLESLSGRGEVELSDTTKRYATYDALCAAQFFKAYRVLNK